MLTRNVRLACRTARRQPLFTATVALTLALAIGANAVIFGMVDAILLRPMPIADPDRVGWIWGVDESRGFDRADLPAADYLDFTGMTTFSHVAAFGPGAYTLTGRGDARRLSALQASPSLFDVWGIRPVLGRRFEPADGTPGAPPVTLLMHGFWTREFGADPAVVGQSIALSGVPHTIVGVLGRDMSYGGLAAIDVWTPYAPPVAGASRTDRRFSVMGLLAPGATIEQAHAEAKTIAARITSEHPLTHASWSARAVDTRSGLMDKQAWLILGMLTLTVTMVLLIASANVTNMLLARMAGRRRELAVRAALGAGRAEIVSQVLIEALVVALLGGLVGLAFSYGSIKVLAALARGNFFFDTLAVNYRVVLFALALSFVAPLMFGLLPALQSSNVQAAAGLSELGSRIAGGRRARRVRNGLVMAQIALATILMVVSTLALRSAVALMRVDLGIGAESLAALRFEVPEWKYKTDPEVHVFIRRLVDRAGAIPGVSSVSAASAVPIIDPDSMQLLEIEGRPLEPGRTRLAARAVGGEQHFATLGIPMLAGRVFDARDREGSRRSAVVSRAAADQYFGGIETAIGQRLRLGDDSGWVTVVGVAADIANPDIDQPPNPTVYLPIAQHPVRSAVVLAASASPDSLPGSLRQALRELDPDVAGEAATFTALWRQEFASTRALVALFVAFGGVALALAAAGLYGVIAFVAAQRTREFGVRAALGARRADIGRLMMGQSGRLIGAGLVAGLAASLALARMITGILYGVSVTDPTTYAAIGALVGVTALGAAYVPARRAMRVNPIDALRAE